MTSAGFGRTRPMLRGRGFLGAAACAVVLAACSSGPSTASSTSTTAPRTTLSTNVASTGPIAPIVGGVTGKPGYLVYWDQNEEVDFLSMPSGTQGQLLPAWDLNGQVCVLPDGRFVGGYDPTLPSQHNSGAPSRTSNRPTGRSSTSPTARSAARRCTCPGPTRCPARASAATRLRPPTACSTTTRPTPGAPSTRPATSSATTSPPRRATTRRPAADGWSSGSRPATPPTASSTARPPVGTGPHHTDGSGGLAQPGMMALADNGDLLVPNVGTIERAPLRPSSLPTSASQCPGGIYPRSKVQVTDFVKGLSFPPGSPRTRRATVSPSAATSATRPSSG